MWKKADIVLKLKAPLHIGYMPFKGSVVSPTRYYVPGRNLWGAITKRITEYLHEKPKACDYKKIGEEITRNFKFSYFYLYDERTIYFPRYTSEGLKYGDNRGGITKSEFEHRFIGSLISTAIDNNGTAKDKSLHEIEFINNRFRDDKEDLVKDVRVVGCIWINEITVKDKKIIINDKGIFIGDFNIIQELILGGESKYGFGLVELESVNKMKFSFPPFNWDDPCNIKLEPGEPLVGHLEYDKNIKFRGDIELLSGRGYFDPKKNDKNSSDKNKKLDNKNEDSNNNDKKPGDIISTPEYYFSPGTVLIKGEKDKIEDNKNHEITIELNWDGTLSIKSSNSN